MRRCRSTAFAGFLVLFPTLAAAQVEQAGDASIVHDTRAGTWSIAAGGATLTLSLSGSRDFEVTALTTSEGKSWIPSAATDSSVIVDGTTFAFGTRASGFVYQNATTSTRDQTVTLDAAFDLPKAGLRVTRHYRAVSGSPTFEAWNTYTPIAGKPVT